MKRPQQQQQANSDRKRKRNPKVQGVDDAGGINKLPDDVIILILSRLLTRNEAARTSLLSRRWRNLWRFSSCGTLELDDNSSAFSTLGLVDRRRRFLDCVNRVLELHQDTCLDDLIIRFAHLGSRSTSRHRRLGYIDKWIYFAMHKELKMFELNLARDGRFHSHYVFPDVDMLSSHSNSHDANVFGFGSLRSLRLVGVDIKDEVVEYFLASCPHLEQLCIRKSKVYMKKLRIVDPLPNLKVLEISDCPFIESLEVSATNLVSCTYQGRLFEKFPFKDNPNLSELTLGGKFSRSFIHEPIKHTSYSVQLVKLALNIPVDEGGGLGSTWKDNFHLHRLHSLEHLHINVESSVFRSLHFFTSLIKASPKLKEFSINVSYVTAESEDTIFGFPDMCTTRESYSCRHENLKAVKMSGYVGCSRNNEFVLRLIEIAPSLQEVTIDTKSNYYGKKPWVCTKGRGLECICTTDQGTGARTRIEAKELAKQLKFKCTPSTKAIFRVT